LQNRSREHVPLCNESVKTDDVTLRGQVLATRSGPLRRRPTRREATSHAGRREQLSQAIAELERQLAELVLVPEATEA
jgi:hypothetical protein